MIFFQNAISVKASNTILQLMTTTPEHDQKIAKLIFAFVYPLYVKKVEAKGRTEKELKQVVKWLTGFNNKKLQQLIKDKVTFEEFFKQATINPNAHLITGMICGYRVEDIENHLTQQSRYMDKFSPLLVFPFIRKPTAAPAFAAVWSPTNGKAVAYCPNKKSKPLQLKSPLVGDHAAAAQKFKRVHLYWYAIPFLQNNFTNSPAKNIFTPQL